MKQSQSRVRTASFSAATHASPVARGTQWEHRNPAAITIQQERHLCIYPWWPRGWDRGSAHDAAEGAVTAILRQAQAADLLRPGVDAQLAAAGLLAMSAGLGTSILVGQRSPESAVAVPDDQLDRVFRAVDAAG